MRPVLAILLTITLIGGIYSYIRFAERVSRPPPEVQIDFSSGEYSIELQRTFDCEGDPILGTESIKVMFKGDKVLAKTENVSAGEELEVRPLNGVEVGENEIYVSANMTPSNQGLGVIKAIVKRNDVVVTETILTSEEGLGIVSGPVLFEIDEVETKDEHDH